MRCGVGESWGAGRDWELGGVSATLTADPELEAAQVTARILSQA